MIEQLQTVMISSQQGFVVPAPFEQGQKLHESFGWRIGAWSSFEKHFIIQNTLLP